MEIEHKGLSGAAEKKESAEILIRNHVILSMGLGLIAIPVLDVIGLTSVQLAMLRKLAKNYKVPFPEHIGKSALMSLIGGAVSAPAAGVLFSAVRVIPFIGMSIAAVTMPLTAGAMTYAAGRIFHQHFASGGTFLTFDPEKVRAYYRKELASFKTF